MNQKTALALLVGILAAAAFRMSGLSLWGVDIRSAAFLSTVATEVNKKMPMMVDAETEMSRAEGLEGVFCYNYRLVNRLASEIDGQRLVAQLKPQVTRAACGAPETRDKFLNRGVVLRYSYADKNQKPIATFDVNPADCGG